MFLLTCLWNLIRNMASNMLKRVMTTATIEDPRIKPKKQKKLDRLALFDSVPKLARIKILPQLKLYKLEREDNCWNNEVVKLDRYGYLPFDFSGMFLFPEVISKTTPCTKFFKKKLDDKYAQLPIKLGDYPTEISNMDEYDYHCTKKESRYWVQAEHNYFSNTDIEEKTRLGHIELFSNIKRFNEAYEYVQNKCIDPETIIKYANRRVGIFNPVSYSTIYDETVSTNVMQEVGNHFLSFDRYDTIRDIGFSFKTLESVCKLYRMIITIAEEYYNFILDSDFESTQEVFDDYIGGGEPNDSTEIPNRFHIHFFDGFFAEGKSQRINEWKEKNEAVVEEFEYFIRGTTVIDDKDILSNPKVSKEDKLIFDKFINRTAVVLTALKIWNITRHNLYTKTTPENTIHIDRGMFSRLYFQHIGVEPKVSEMFADFYGPLCMYYDVIQSVFVDSPQSMDAPLVKLRFQHTFLVNSMKDNDHDWRQNQPDLRDMEFLLYPNRTVEKQQRMIAYKEIIYTYPSLINTLTMCAVIENEEKTEFQFVAQMSELEKLTNPEVPLGYLGMIAEFINVNSFQNRLEKIFDVTDVTTDA